MNLFLFFFYFSQESLLTLDSPFTRTAPRELGEWTLRGQAVSQKRVIHLTSGIANVSGGICARLPTDALEFDVDVDFLLNQDTFIISFSKNLCPEISSFFNGMNISFTPIDDNKNLKVRLTGSEIFPNHEKIIQNFDFSQKHIISISKTQSNFILSIKNTNMDQINFTLPHLYQYCYFSLFSFSPTSCEGQCYTNIYKFDYIPRSPIRDSDKNLSIRNIKALKSSQDKRQIMKMNRRAQMEKVAEYIDQSVSLNDTFTDSKSIKLSDAMIEINEVKKRAESRISASDLNYLLDNKVQPVLDKAAARYEKVALALFQTKNEMITLWKHAANQLKDMRSEINVECSLIEDEARKMMLNIKEHKEYNIGKNDTLNKINLTHILHIICIIEFICYVIFFASQHRRMSRKKRY